MVRHWHKKQQILTATNTLQGQKIRLREGLKKDCLINTERLDCPLPQKDKKE